MRILDNLMKGLLKPFASFFSLAYLNTMLVFTYPTFNFLGFAIASPPT